MKQYYPVIALTGGGSGGHITPLLSLARELKKAEPDCQLIYIGHKGDQFDTRRSSGHDFDFLAFVNAGKFRRYHGESLLSHLLDVKMIILNIRDFFRVVRSIGAAYRILSKTKPDVLFVKGGFVGVPVGIAARLKRIPIITHDSDTVGGLANKIVGRWAQIHATGMPAKYYSYPKRTVEYVGIPLDENIKEVTPQLQTQYKKEIGLSKESQLILVAGGGNGSKKLNDLIISAAPELLKTHVGLHIIDIAGNANAPDATAGFKDVLDKTQRERVEVLAFTEEFYKYSGAADVIISRAGATAIAEFAAQAKACVIIPSPFLAAGHQLKNAELLAEKDAAVVLPEESEADELLAVLNELLRDDRRRWHLAKNMHGLSKPGAAEKLASIVLEVAKR